MIKKDIDSSPMKDVFVNLRNAIILDKDSEEEKIESIKIQPFDDLGKGLQKVKRVRKTFSLGDSTMSLDAAHSPKSLENISML